MTVRPCIFCEIVQSRAPASLVFDDSRFLAFLDIYPILPGHTLVIPRRHVARLAELPADELAGLMALSVRLGDALRRGIGCKDVNLVVNDGAAANQTVPHVHVHLIARRGDDILQLLRRLCQRPIQSLLGGPPRAELDAQAATIRAAL